jgi:diguanylate cyclase (GGDEF)-like protein
MDLAMGISASEPRDRLELDQMRDRSISAVPTTVAALTVAGVTLSELMSPGVVAGLTRAGIAVLSAAFLLGQVRGARQRNRIAQHWKAAATTDGLTGLYNRRLLDQLLQGEARRASLCGTPISLIMIDLDHFKLVNDTYGHLAGDAVLVEVASRLRQSLRMGDVISRYGGEEFVCVLPVTGHQDALKIAEYIRSALPRTPMAIDGECSQLTLTASIGVVTFPPEAAALCNGRQMLQSADEAMYNAKVSGRNRVVGFVPRSPVSRGSQDPSVSTKRDDCRRADTPPRDGR